MIVVSSGAMASGRGELRIDHSLDSVEQRQLFSAVGQVKLVGLYYDLFREFGIHVGQVLTMKENFEPGEQYRNQRACMMVMLLGPSTTAPAPSASKKAIPRSVTSVISESRSAPITSTWSA